MWHSEAHKNENFDLLAQHLDGLCAEVDEKTPTVNIKDTAQSLSNAVEFVASRETDEARICWKW
jgi:hypothetical protein